MSSYANFIIEFNENDKWVMWRGLKRFVEHSYTTCENGELKQIITTPDYDEPNIGKVDTVDYIWKQGAVRDLFGITYMGTKFKNAGLPKDVSSDTEDALNKHMSYKTNTTYAYLSDIQEYVDSELERFFKDLESLYEKKYFYNAIIKQINAISADLLKKKEISKDVKEDEYDINEDIQYNTQEWIYDIISIQSFCQEIRTLVEEIGNAKYLNDFDIRLICWID